MTLKAKNMLLLVDVILVDDRALTSIHVIPRYSNKHSGRIDYQTKYFADLLKDSK